MIALHQFPHQSQIMSVYVSPPPLPETSPSRRNFIKTPPPPPQTEYLEYYCQTKLAPSYVTSSASATASNPCGRARMCVSVCVHACACTCMDVRARVLVKTTPLQKYGAHRPLRPPFHVLRRHQNIKHSTSHRPGKSNLLD